MITLLLPLAVAALLVLGFVAGVIWGTIKERDDWLLLMKRAHDNAYLPPWLKERVDQVAETGWYGIK